MMKMSEAKPLWKPKIFSRIIVGYIKINYKAVPKTGDKL